MSSEIRQFHFQFHKIIGNTHPITGFIIKHYIRHGLVKQTIVQLEIFIFSHSITQNLFIYLARTQNLPKK